MIKSTTKKIKDTCSFLGPEYTVKSIDHENVIYRDLGNGYDFEISGLDNKSPRFHATLYIWSTKNTNKIVETVDDLNSLEDLKQTLNAKVTKYICLT